MIEVFGKRKSRIGEGVDRCSGEGCGRRTDEETWTGEKGGRTRGVGRRVESSRVPHHTNQPHATSHPRPTPPGGRLVDPGKWSEITRESPVDRSVEDHPPSPVSDGSQSTFLPHFVITRVFDVFRMVLGPGRVVGACYEGREDGHRGDPSTRVWSHRVWGPHHPYPPSLWTKP